MIGLGTMAGAHAGQGVTAKGDAQAGTPGAMPGAAPVATATHASLRLRGIEVRGCTLLDEATLRATLQPWLHRDLSENEYRQIPAALEAAYRDRGWMARARLMPPQARTGMAELRVVEARAGGVRIAEPGGADTPRVSASLARQAKKVVTGYLRQSPELNLATLEHGVMLAGELPGLRVAAKLHPGATVGTTDVELQLSPGPRIASEIAVDNRAHYATGAWRQTGKISFESPWGEGERITLAAQANGRAQGLQADASIPLGSRGLRLAALAALSHFQSPRADATALLPPTALPTAGSSGHGMAVGVEARWPVARRAGLLADARLGVAVSRRAGHDLAVDTAGATDAALAHHAGLAPLTPAAEGQQRAAYVQLDLQQTDASGERTDGTLELAALRHSDRGTPDDAAPATQGNGLQLRLDVGQTVPLGGGWSADWRLRGQLATRNQDAAERFDAGGPNGLAVLPTGEVQGAQGATQRVGVKRSFVLAGGGRGSGGLALEAAQVQVLRNNQRRDATAVALLRNQARTQAVTASVQWQPSPALALELAWSRRLGGDAVSPLSGHELPRQRVTAQLRATF